MPSYRAIAAAGVAVAALAVTAFVPAWAGAPGDNLTQPAVQNAPASPLPGSPSATADELTRRYATLRSRPGAAPRGPNPALAYVPDPSRLDWAGWRAYEHRLSSATSPVNESRSRAARSLAAAGSAAPRTIAELERAGSRGDNDTLRRAQPLTAFKVGAPVVVAGQLSPATAPKQDALPPNTEEDGTIETARDTGLSTTRRGFTTTGVIGDNLPDPANPRRTDVDWYKVVLRPGDLLEVKVSRTSGDLIPDMLLTSSSGDRLAQAEPDFDAHATLNWIPRTAGTYYLAVLGLTKYDQEAVTPITFTKGAYALNATARAGDQDVYRVTLGAGDVLGASVDGGAGYVSVFDANGVEVHGSGQNLSAWYPTKSPLPGGGNAVTDHVAPRAGTYYVEISAGSGRYRATLEMYKYGGSSTRQLQTIYLDTDGERLNTRIFFGGSGVATLSPLRQFLPAWGVSAAQEKDLVRRIQATVQRHLNAELRASGLSRNIGVKVVTRYDGPDPWGKPNVTRLIIGGTIAQSGVRTIGIAPSVDPGNFDREETGLLMLDALSAKTPEAEEAGYSLNKYLTERSDRIAFIGRTLGNIATHEICHMLGNWHVDETNDKANLMDAGGSFAQFFGVGKDQTGGTADDTETKFGTDTFAPNEGFTGVEDTEARTAWAVTSRSG